MEENELIKKRRDESELIIVNGFHFSPEIRFRPNDKSRSYGYTSLKDLLPSASESAAAIMAASYSPAASSSWNEIPIKNHLVKHAAMAYLQPMSAQAAPSKGLLAKLRDRLGCVTWLCDAVLRLFGSGEDEEDDEDDDDDDVDEGGEINGELKVG